ncbi:MAG: hypothetical protein B7733_06755 [Myxococcales bacterium FL481]|nr:MAG: hypothetical protein B7733_06755 [Myxococcales bacterium FL481]
MSAFSVTACLPAPDDAQTEDGSSDAPWYPEGHDPGVEDPYDPHNPHQPEDPGHEDGDEDGWDDPGDDSEGDCTYCDLPRPTGLKMDLTAAVGLAVVSEERKASRWQAQPAGAGQVLRFADTNGRRADDPADEPDSGEEDEDAGAEDDLLKLGDDGTLEPAMEESTPEGAEDLTEDELDQMWDPGPLPRISAVGLSPDGSVYVLFEYAFLYKMVDPNDPDTDHWSPSSPYTCQLFRTSASWDQLDNPSATTVGDLECVTNQHEIASWHADKVMQFDMAGNVYFPAIVPDSWREVFYRYDPNASSLSEKVNANICWYDVEVTPIGSVFYTGASSTNGDCDGTSFFRYISTDNQLTEIARDWWDFKYLAERDPDLPENERIIFYGPDPNADTEWSWDTACIYRYDPQITDPAERISSVVECMNSGWEYVWGDMPHDAWEQTPTDRLGFADRCEAEGDVFVGGEGVSELAQTQDGSLFVAGTFRVKTPGSFSCSLKIEGADHCNTADPSHDTPQACAAAGGEWLVVGEFCSDPAYVEPWECETNGGIWNWGAGSQWYDQVTGAGCLTTDDPALEDVDAGVYYRPGWVVDWVNCEPQDPNQHDYVETVDGFAVLSTAGDESTEITLLSGEDEDVEAFWVVDSPNGTQFFYSTYAFGVYSLRSASVSDTGEVVHRTILSDYEVYNVMVDPADANRILFDGLYFATNTYMFGSVDASLPTEEEVLASIELVGGYTGQIDTLVIFPSW